MNPLSPETSHREKVNLQRLLTCSERLVQQDKGKGGLSDVTRLRLVTHIRTLRDKVATLQEKGDREAVNPTELAEFHRRVQILAGCVDETQLLSPIDRNLSKSRVASFLQTNGTSRDRLMVDLGVQRRAQAQERQQLIQLSPEGHVPGGRDEEESISVLRQRLLDRGIEEEGDAETMVSRHRERQAELSSDLVRMAGILKAGAVSFSDRLASDSTLVAEVQGALSGSLERLQKEGTRLGNYAAKASKTTILTWSVMLFVCLLFVMTYLAIRILPRF